MVIVQDTAIVEEHKMQPRNPPHAIPRQSDPHSTFFGLHGLRDPFRESNSETHFPRKEYKVLSTFRTKLSLRVR